MLSQTAAARETAFFYLRQIQGDLENLMLFSDGRGLSSRIVSRMEREVRVETRVYEGLWSSFPAAIVASFRVPDAEKSKIHALNNHVLRIQIVEGGERTESNYMVPHAEAPEKLTAWIERYLRVFEEPSESGRPESVSGGEKVNTVPKQ